MTDRYIDLLKQGFMRAGLQGPKKRKVKEPVPIVTCYRCKDWHRKGKHTKPADAREEVGDE